MSKTNPNITLKATSMSSTYIPYVKCLIFGGTNMGKTYLCLNSYFEYEKEKKVIFINTDQPENFAKNFNMLSEDEQKRVIQPHDGNVMGARLGDKDAIKSIVNEILKPPISTLIRNGEVSLIAVDSLDVIQEAYEDWEVAHDFGGTPDMFLKGRARKAMEKEFLVPLINLPCNFIATSFYENVYPETGGPFKQVLEAKIDNVKATVRRPVSNGRYFKHFTSIMELRNLFPHDAVKSQINGYFIKSKWFQGLYGYHKISGDKKTKRGPSYAQLLQYDREGKTS